jgi:hypothetical protein
MKADEVSAKPDEVSVPVGNVLPIADAASAESVLASYRRAFAGFTEEERAILDGIILEPAD